MYHTASLPPLSPPRSRERVERTEAKGAAPPPSARVSVRALTALCCACEPPPPREPAEAAPAGGPGAACGHRRCPRGLIWCRSPRTQAQRTAARQRTAATTVHQSMEAQRADHMECAGGLWIPKMATFSRPRDKHLAHLQVKSLSGKPPKHPLWLWLWLRLCLPICLEVSALALALALFLSSHLRRFCRQSQSVMAWYAPKPALCVWVCALCSISLSRARAPARSLLLLVNL